MLMTLLCVFSASPGPAGAHEVRPSVADVVVSDGTVRIDVDVTLEAFVANVDLEGLQDTDAAANAADYDRLRSLPPKALEQAFRETWPSMRADMFLEAGGERVLPTLVSVLIDPVGNTALPRDSRITLEAQMTGPVSIGWAPRFGDLILRQQGVAEADAYTGLLSGGEMSPPLTATGGSSEGTVETLVRYIGVGFDHIIPKGLDHILFVLGLFFLAPRVVPLIWQVSAFTLAHTVTLALGAAGWVSVPAEIVEPLIAASIVFVAVENMLTSGLHRWRPVLVFGFGLLHGLGFASVLGEFGLPPGQFIPALIGFNIGVEVGQIAVIAVAFLAVGIWFRERPWYRQRISIPASGVIAAVGVFWVIERVFL